MKPPRRKTLSVARRPGPDGGYRFRNGIAGTSWGARIVLPGELLASVIISFFLPSLFLFSYFIFEGKWGTDRRFAKVIFTGVRGCSEGGDHPLTYVRVRIRNLYISDAGMLEGSTSPGRDGMRYSCILPNLRKRRSSLAVHFTYPYRTKYCTLLMARFHA